jgi:hypothetical protein
MRRDGMIVRQGVHKELEDAANEMLRVSMSGITKHSDKADILTPWKEQSRRSREVYVPSGSPDSSLRRGSFHRDWNSQAPHLNSVEGFAPPPKMPNNESPAIQPTVRWDDE